MFWTYNIVVSDRGQYPHSIGDRRRGGHSLPLPLVGLAVGSGIVGDEAIPGLSAHLNFGVLQAGLPDEGPFTYDLRQIFTFTPLAYY